ncbi:MAG: S41 family peptidase [Bacteroidetes bacterium]|nr:MAG: S41 family peptidase [Bacteroidota bacterium]
MRTRLLLPALFILTLVSGIAVGSWMPRDDTFFALRKNFQIFGAVYEELVGGYVDPLDPERFMRTGLDAMLEDLDPYTTFIDEADNADIDIMTRGRYGGVGLNVGLRGGKLTVIAPVEGASGFRQGVRTGDVITHIAGQPTAGLSQREVGTLLRGEPGTTVEIRVEREGVPEPLTFVLTREQVRLRNVTYAGFVRDDTAAGIGYVKLERFARDAAPEVRRAIQDLEQTGALRGLVLDLRDNPGGLLDAAVEITQLFVPQGSVIVSTRGRLPETERVYRSKLPPLVPDLPLAVLINEFSASASEIVAGAVQDLDRGVIVGTTSFGKGLVQVIRPLPHNTSLKMTTSRYFTPSGRSIQALDYGRHDGTATAIPDSLRRTFRTRNGRAVQDGRGIEPDVTVSPGPPSELEEALLRRAAFFFFANAYVARHPLPDATARDERTFDPDDPAFALDMDAVLAEFQRWLQTQDFSYRTAAERATASLSAELAEIGYDAAQDEVAALERAIREEKQADFARHADRLKDRLRTEILARYLGETAQIKAALHDDPTLDRALGLLADPAAYTALLDTP